MEAMTSTTVKFKHQDIFDKLCCGIFMALFAELKTQWADYLMDSLAIDMGFSLFEGCFSGPFFL